MITAAQARTLVNPSNSHGQASVQQIKDQAAVDAAKISLDVRLACHRGLSAALCMATKRSELRGGDLAYIIYKNEMTKILNSAGFRFSFWNDGTIMVRWDLPDPC